MKAELKRLFSNKAIRAAAIGIAALLLLLCVWLVFFGGEKSEESYRPTEEESRLCNVLERIDGVGGVTVLIGDADGVPVSAVVVFDGADSLMTRMRVAEVTAAALNIERGSVQVYPSRNN